MTEINSSANRVSLQQSGFVRLVAWLGLLGLSVTFAQAQALEGPPAPVEPSTVQPLPKVQNPNSTVIARVNGKPIFQNEVERALAGIPHTANLEPSRLASAQAAVLQKLIERQLIHEFLTAQKSLASDAEIDVAIEHLRQTLQQQNTTLEDMLARSHQTEAILRNGYVYELGWNKYVAHNTNDETMQALFKKFHEQFDGTERRVSHILLRPEGTTDETKLKDLVEQAKKLRDQIESGSISFEDAAQKYSAGPSHSRGGDLGYIPLNGVMAEQFSKTAFALQPDEISQPVGTPFGIHLIKVTDVKTGKKTWQDARDALQQAMSNFLFSQVLKNQLDKATIEYSAGVPHFKKGTAELEASETAANLQ
jgi:parvulin-like peptidyl-prolyl isomerase